MKNFLLCLFISLFALPSLAMERQETPPTSIDLSPLSETSGEIHIIANVFLFMTEVDRAHLALACQGYYMAYQDMTKSILKDYEKHTNSLLECQSIFDLTETHFDFFHHVRCYFPEMLDALNLGGVTALHKAVMGKNTIASIFLRAFGARDDIRIPTVGTVASLIEKDKRAQWTYYWPEHFEVKSWAQRSEILKGNNDGSLWDPNMSALISIDANRNDHEILDILINAPYCAVRFDNETSLPLHDIIIEHKRDSNYYKIISLFLNAGSILEIERIESKYNFYDIICDDTLRELFFKRKLFSKTAIEKSIRVLIECGKPGDNSKNILNFLLSNRESADVNACEGNQNALTLAIKKFNFYSNPTPSTFDPITQLLLAGADPHHPIPSSQIPPVIQMLDRFRGGQESSLLYLLEECKKRHFKREDFKEWTSKNKKWVVYPQLCNFLLENGIVDPLMDCRESYPLKHALDSIFEDFEEAEGAFESLKVILPHCRHHLTPEQLTLTIPNNSYFEFNDGRLYFLIKEGFTCGDFFKNNSTYGIMFRWTCDPELCELLLEKGIIDPLMECVDTYRNPLKVALDSLDRKCGSYDNQQKEAALKSVELMARYCSERLTSNRLTLTKNQIEYLKEVGKLDWFLQNGFILPN